MLTTYHRVIIGNSSRMPELADSSVQLVVTSPPYPMIKMWDGLFAKEDTHIADLWQKISTDGNDFNVTSLYKALHDRLALVWEESFRVLVEGGLACINVGDATRTVRGKFRLFANHSKIIEHCERIGFSTLPFILWRKPTNKPKYKGRGAFLGSGFLPPNAYVTQDCEYILIFRKGGLRAFPSHDPERYGSAFSKKERDVWFSQIWNVTGSRQNENQLERRTAAFPEEIVNRLVRMFSVRGDTILDPFLGSGTTTKVAIKTERNSVGYEVDQELLPLIRTRIGSGLRGETGLSYEMAVSNRTEEDQLFLEDRA